MSNHLRTQSLVFGIPWPELNEGLFYSDVVPHSDSELTLIDFYSRKYKNSAPLQGWLQRIQNGQISVDGRVVKDPNTILSGDSVLVYHRLPWKEPDVPHLLEVLYEDDDMVALNKPSGLQVLPGGLFQQRTVLTQLCWSVKKQNSTLNSQETHPVPVHRLGRGTSDNQLTSVTWTLMCVGYWCVRHGNRKAERSGTRKISKIYRALVTGILVDDKVIINQPIGIVRYPGVAKGLYVASPSGKPALSKVEVLERDEKQNCTLVQVEIESGRPHQIRIHLSFIGHPLLGDPLYIAGDQPRCFDPELVDESFAQDGGYQRPTNPVPGDCGYYLHAHQLVLSHPTTNEMISITAPLSSILQTSDEANGSLGSMSVNSAN
ncbi:hypothetical protein ES332_A06G199500v1 [Gossypium tomentosum]|uniref:Pseudouridine synthase RsuA/RluA-like domain-containing protein n=1 Tax=Gossypium tomentosum TaxID=34277 RepID=A0A5D2Q784_GOSTO|nr:hypothetical protein ES332_A06G199500v1 [Gossypium tomentosum]